MPPPETIEFDPQKVQDALAVIRGEIDKAKGLSQEDKKRLLSQIKGEEIQSDLRPIGWKEGSVASYYKEDWANKLKPILDDLIANEGQHDYFFDRKKSRNSVRSTALYVNQAWLYLCERHPEKDKYLRLKRLTKVTKEKGGVRIVWVVPAAGSGNPDAADSFGQPEKVARETITEKNWREQFDGYIDNAEEGELLQLLGLELKPEDLEYIKSAVEDIKYLHVVNMEKNKVKIVKNSGVPRP